MFPLTYRPCQGLAALPRYLALAVAGIKLPVICTVSDASSASTSALPLELLIELTVVVVVNSRTSIKSPASGASVNVNTQVGSTPDTEYAVPGICTTPLILTIQLLVV